MKWEIIEKNLIYQKIAKIWEIRLRFEKFQGGFSQICHWFVLEKGNAVAGVLFDPKLKKVLLVRQFRPMGIFFPDDEQHQWMTEIIAGGLHTGENPKDGFLRECLEEAGIEPTNLKLIYRCYPSPGFYGERMYFYYAEFDSQNFNPTPKGLEQENENILPLLFSLEQIEKLLHEGYFADSKTIMGMLWLLNQHR